MVIAREEIEDIVDEMKPEKLIDFFELALRNFTIPFVEDYLMEDVFDSFVEDYLMEDVFDSIVFKFRMDNLHKTNPKLVYRLIETFCSQKILGYDDQKNLLELEALISSKDRINYFFENRIEKDLSRVGNWRIPRSIEVKMRKDIFKNLSSNNPSKNVALSALSFLVREKERMIDDYVPLNGGNLSRKTAKQLISVLYDHKNFLKGKLDDDIIDDMKILFGLSFFDREDYLKFFSEKEVDEYLLQNKKDENIIEL